MLYSHVVPQEHEKRIDADEELQELINDGERHLTGLATVFRKLRALAKRKAQTTQGRPTGETPTKTK